MAPAGSHAHLLRALHRRGVHDAVVRALTLRAPSRHALREPLGAFLRDALPAASHFGIGIAPAGTDGPIVTVVLVRRLVSVAVRGRRLCGRLLRGAHPTLYVAGPQGRVQEVGLRSHRRTFCGRLPLRKAGRYRLELTVETAYGPEVGALLPYDYRVAPPPGPVHRLYPRGDGHASTAALERRLRSLINRTREREGLPRLRPASVLAGCARAQSRDMRDTGFFGHVSPRRGALTERLARAGLSDFYATENLALATSVRRAHESLMRSPSHRRNVLDRRVTHLGVGIARVRGLLYITEWFAHLR